MECDVLALTAILRQQHTQVASSVTSKLQIFFSFQFYSGNRTSNELVFTGLMKRRLSLFVTLFFLLLATFQNVYTNQFEFKIDWGKTQ